MLAVIDLSGGENLNIPTIKILHTVTNDHLIQGNMWLFSTVLEIDFGPLTANLWSDWNPQKRANCDKWNQ